MADILVKQVTRNIQVHLSGRRGPIGPSGLVESVVAGTNITVDNTDPANPIVSSSGGGGGGAVDSVNSQTGVVVLDTDDISDASATNKYVTAAEKTKLSNLSGTNTGDQDLSGYVPTSRTVNTKALSSNITLNQDEVLDGTTYKQYSATEKTKLAGIATGATANSSDATLLARANHTGTQAISTVSGLQAALDAKEATANKGIAGGYAELDGSGKVPTAQLPAYVDDVVEAANFAALPGTGESGKIYVTLDDNKVYRWSGSAYVEISASLALGETSSTAYRGDRGKTAYDHSQLTSGNPHNVTKSDVGLANADNTSDANKPVSTAQQTAIDGKVADAINDGTTTVAPSQNAVFDALALKQPLDSDLTTIAGLTATTDSIIQSKSSAWTTRTPAQFKTDLVLVKGDVGLGNVDNTSDANKPVSTATQTALDAKQPLDSDLTTIAGLTATTDNFMVGASSAWASRTPAQAKTSLALTKTDVGLSNVDNTADTAKPVSTAQQTALDLKANIASPTLTGTPAAPTAAAATNTTQIATTAHVFAERTNSATLTNKTLTSPVINTPTGIVKGDVGLGNVDNTSNATERAATATLTNKRITKRTGTTTSSATPTIATDSVDYYSITALAVDITSFTTNLSGTPTTGQTLWLAITGTASRAITWGATFESSTVTLPSTTSSTNRLDVGFVWNEVTLKWRCVSVA